MTPFDVIRPLDIVGATRAARELKTAMIAGGTTLVDLMRLEVMTPEHVVDLNALPLAAIEPLADGGVSIGALATNAAVAAHPAIVARYPVLAEAILAGASPQVRNAATTAGNLLQRTRCPYFRDLASACNKRDPGSGCSAVDGFARTHAVLGGSAHCIAVHPSDMCVALVALDAMVHVQAAAGATRAIPIVEFHTVPANTPDVETVLAPGDLVTHVELPARPFARRSCYVKVRDRASFAFALASAAVAIAFDGTIVSEARVALGGVATKPWRTREVEAALIGQPLTIEVIQRAARAAMRDAHSRPSNAYKIDLARRTIERALARVGGLS
jgi:xanthine dehydrogenase YagS FAD-binding subunit